MRHRLTQQRNGTKRATRRIAALVRTGTGRTLQCPPPPPLPPFPCSPPLTEEQVVQRLNHGGLEREAIEEREGYLPPRRRRGGPAPENDGVEASKLHEALLPLRPPRRR